MHDLVFDTEPLVQAISKGVPMDDGRCRVFTLPFESRHAGFLRPEDRDIEENRRFTYVMVEPAASTPRAYADILLIFHGLNEGSYAKLVPWAYNLACLAEMPVLIFPMAFHINRRSNAWGFSNQLRLYNLRRRTPDIHKVSPFNATISERFAQAPDRLFRGGLQTYYDVLTLCDHIRSGSHPGCRPGARPHCLGYSAGGYLALVLMLADPGGRFGDSRCILFASGADLDGVHPASIFILDAHADHRMIEFFRTRQYEQVAFDPAVAALTSEPERWLTEVFFHGPRLAARIEALQTRLRAIANIGDEVITAEGMVRNLDRLDVRHFALGIHELPFTLPGPLPDTYDRHDKATKAAISGAHNSSRIGESYREAFGRFIDEVAGFLRT
ncbi:MAG: hypothetical protein HY710_13920 [Candidatus Latescibacteria bacterium]|nr:hypothetical protein [Candidatus Latescibacterota bacterium]